MKKKPLNASGSDESQIPVDSKEKPATSERLVKWCLFIGVISLVALPAIALNLAAWKYKQDKARQASEVAATAAPPLTSFGGTFSLVNQDGETVTDATFRGKYMLVFFGYTYCPDLCPTALQNITETLDELGPDADKLQVLFITVDPERDTPAKLKDYVSSFHPQITGLTGTPQQIASVAKAYGVKYEKVKMPDFEDYIMDHTTLMFVLGPDGKPLTSIDMEQVDPASIAATLQALWSPQKPLAR